MKHPKHRVPKAWAEIVAESEEVVLLDSPEDADKLFPDRLGAMVASTTIRDRGWYGCTRDGVKTLYTLEV